MDELHEDRILLSAVPSGPSMGSGSQYLQKKEMDEEDVDESMIPDTRLYKKSL